MRHLRDKAARLGARRLLAGSKLFDPHWYRLANPYILRDGIDPLDHFLRHGRRYRLSPSRAFDTARYLDEHEEARASALNPLVHYLRHGRRRGLAIHPAAPSEADRIAASGLFDPDWYSSRYPDSAGQPPLLHFMAFGAAAGRSPGPDFDCAWYLAHYPDIAGANPLLHYIDHGRAEGRMPLAPVAAIETARTVLAGVEDLEPELDGADYFADAERLRIVTGVPHHRLADAFEAIVGRIASAPRAIVFVSGPDGAAAGPVLHALAEAYDAPSVLVVATEIAGEEASFLPRDMQRLSLPEIDAALSPGQRAELADLLVRALQPDVTLAAGSHAAWEAIRDHGRRLAGFTRLYALLPDADDPCVLHLRHCLSHLSGVYFGDAGQIGAVTRRFGIPALLQDRLVALAPDAACHDILTGKGGLLAHAPAGHHRDPECPS